jgi:hypothetical protein
MLNVQRFRVQRFRVQRFRGSGFKGLEAQIFMTYLLLVGIFKPANVLTHKEIL